MATALPQKTVRFKDDAKIMDKNKTSLEILMQMGFSKHRAEKAIAVTGDKGPQVAADWLLFHATDPTIDQKTPQEFVLYLCPVGPLQKQLSEFFEKSLSQCGWNGAHAYFPHITLCHFFTAEDSRAPFLSKALVKLANQLCLAPGRLQLEFFSRVSFIGLFVDKTFYEYLEDIMAVYSDEISKVGVTMDPHRQQLHMTLAYQYPKEQHDKLMKLAKEIDLIADVKWEMRLYSRDPRAAESEVRRVTRPFTPGSNMGEELELIDEDFILADPRELTSTKDGWCRGISHLTGNVGLFPVVLTIRTAETSIWMLHRSVSVVSMYNGLNDSDYDNVWQEEQNSRHNKSGQGKRAEEAKKVVREPRQLLVMRHGERCDFAFGKDWVDMCFNPSGKYTRINLNLPKVMLKRKSYLDYIKDCPLTEVGKLQARLTGEALRDSEISISHLYVSPALRCVQTAQEIITALDLKLKMCLEPAIFEWLGWYQLGIPTWCTEEELAEQGYQVDKYYISFMVATQLHQEETVEHHYSRCADFTRFVLRKHEIDGGNMLFVGHAGSLDVCTRQLLGKAPRSMNGFQNILHNIPCCAMCACIEEPTGRKWRLKEPPVPGISHIANKKYSWKALI